MRKFQKNKEYLEVPFTSAESGYDVELDYLDASLSVSGNENEEILRLQNRIAALEEILAQHSVPFPTSLNNSQLVS